MTDQWSRVQQNSTCSVWEFETTHGRPAPSRTPDLKYDPQKAMKKAEKEYLASKGIVKRTFRERMMGGLENFLLKFHKIS